MNQQASTEVLPCLHQVVCTEVVLSEWALIITAEGTFHRVDTWMGLVLVEESHPGSGLFRFLVAEPRVGVYKERVYRT